MTLESLDFAGWQDFARRTRAIAEAAARVGGEVHGERVVVRDCTMVLVPGGEATLGWDGAPVALEPGRRALWRESADFEGSFEELLRYHLGPSRVMTFAPFLLEVTTRPAMDLVADEDDLEAVVRAAIAAEGFRLPTSDEWEHAFRAGATALFPWGDTWPDGDPWGTSTTFRGHLEIGALGLVRSANPYDVELVAELDQVRAGDGGSALCGGRPSPEAWYTFAHAFRHPQALFEDVVFELYEQAFVRRALSFG